MRSATNLTVVANADDPMVVYAAADAVDPVWVAAGQRWLFDSTSCPACGDLIARDPDARGWSSRCGLARPEPAWAVHGTTVIDPDGATHDVTLSLPGAVNVANAAMAAAAAAFWRVPPERAFRAMRDIAEVEGRYLQADVDGIRTRLLLAKNPAGWAEALGLARPGAPVVVAVNARAADGRDPSWLWDVPFEVLRGRIAVASGERSRDVAVRLRYAGVEHERVDDPAAAIVAASGSGPVDVLANYTAFQAFRRVLSRA
jgi:UDP-N-acetylmuramyl tripeptide synthase